MDLPLSAPVKKVLSNLGTIPIEITKVIVKESIKQMLNPNTTITPIPELYEKYADIATQSEYAVVTVLSLAIKHGLDAEKLRLVLEKEMNHKAAMEFLIQTYKEHQKDLLFRQLEIGYNFPHVSDVEWRIISDVKSSTSSASSSEVGFQINLGRFNQQGERETIVEFLCNTEELQLLINKLKEIERHCDNVTNEVS